MRRAAVFAVMFVAALSFASPASARPVAIATSTTCTAAGQPDRVWQVAQSRLAEQSAPRSTFPFGVTGHGTYQRTNAYAWTSGFYPASLWLMYERTHAPSWLALARSFTNRVLPVASWTGTHDLGFMVGLPAALGARLDPSPTRQDRYRAAIVTAARSLSARWNDRVGAIKSGEYGGRWGVIIDSAMNAPMLLEAAAMVDGAVGERLRARGLRHMLTLTQDFIRPDGSTIHRQVFNPRTGSLIGPTPGQGLSTTSTWARGQAWAINGFTQAYALSGDERLLDAARRTADYWLAHVRHGCVPAWDLDVTSDRAPRDSSAAAIAADGLQSLGRSDPDPTRASRYLIAGQATAAALSHTAWAPDDAGGSGILQRQAYNIPAIAREGSYVWGDVYLLLALSTG